MKNLDISCPSCSNPAVLTQSHRYSQTSIGAVFQCANTACRNEFGGVVTLTANLPAGVERFSSGTSSTTDSDADGYVLTDV
ncbi:hypothetical protein [Parazoarcus communis]|uniref:Uncharacterized protein n=1 Tax=Parazoarcus communis SWub3 = DSM 12120 TaxID=1121029 RepID=A0A323UTS2_9RHOO|nr:hypothetical protein [Parazoarcus communis]NMG72285.1 hypothetical protein [Parazoarcus communis SWub3 = DSM 12120]PZA16422.1 hypothetical protein DNK49_12290 [Azoarcus communis] [Parazoarcus communis SWub3 = DSM 12120]